MVEPIIESATTITKTEERETIPFLQKLMSPDLNMRLVFIQNMPILFTSKASNHKIEHPAPILPHVYISQRVGE